MYLAITADKNTCTIRHQYIDIFVVVLQQINFLYEYFQLSLYMIQAKSLWKPLNVVLSLMNV